MPMPGPAAVVSKLTKEIEFLALLNAGVKRISVGGSIARAALGLVRRAARELRDLGTVSYGADQIPQSELNQVFERAQAARSQFA
jgi:2-methylisocitrate lyase-like PEP mutase family enzyme